MKPLILTILAIFWGTLFIQSAFTYLFFWYETASSPHRDHLEQLSKGCPGRLILKGILLSFISQHFVFLFYPLRFWHRLWKPEPHRLAPYPPLLFVHGLYHNRSAWVLYRWWLKREGFANMSAFEYNSWSCTFDEVLKKLEAAVEEITERFPGEKLILIGHSAGGLLCRAYSDLPQNAEKLAAVVTLGAPHQGSKLAALGLGKLARSLLYKGPLIQQLESRKSPPGIPRIAIYSPLDNMVLPNDANHITDPQWLLVESKPINHVFMLYHRATAKLVIERLQTSLLHTARERTDGSVVRFRHVPGSQQISINERSCRNRTTTSTDS